MLPVRTMTPITSSKQSSAAASKIKNKLLNTSSFFKVSLKKNNKALAVALEMQKERSRQLEKDIMFLQKQVEALCFELAAKKYKHRKLVGLLFENINTQSLVYIKRRSSQHKLVPGMGLSRPSCSLMEEVDRLSRKISQSGFDMKSVPCPQNSQTPSASSLMKTQAISLRQCSPSK
uniref:Uncharacterized protein n=1 Tax=Labrus bergylta TaxID=56723 RepID=A0A3Q3GFR9_9LABR